jgi:hypothetical protein
MAKSYSKEWPILPMEETTQSNTYLPLICSVIDGFNVDFPNGYVDVFIKAIKRYKKIGPLPFDNFAEFQEYLKMRLEYVGLSRKTFFKNCDDPDNYHVLSYVQEEIMEDLDGFFNLFIPMLIQFSKEKHELFKSHADSILTCSLKDTSHPNYAQGEAARFAAADAADAPRKAAHAKRLDARTRLDEWYALDEYGRKEDYSDEVNRQINAAGRDDPPFMTKIDGFTYLIDTNGLMEENLAGKKRRILSKRKWYYIEDGRKIPYSDDINHELNVAKRNGQGVKHDDFIIPLTMSRVDRKGNSHRIVYEGGKTKRRRSIYKRTRHHA